MQGISIVTLNTWKGEGDYPARMATTIDLLAGLDPDIVLLQEVFAVPSRGLCAADTLSAALGLHCAFHPARKKMRPFEGGDVLSQSGLAVLARAEILSSSPVALPDDPRDGERMAQIVRIGGAAPVTVLNLHLTHLPDAAALRRQQLIAALSALPDGINGPVIAGGDFNDAVDDGWLAPVAPALPGLTIRNTRHDVPNAPATPTLVDPPSDGRPGCIDHILTVRAAESGPVGTLETGHHGGREVSDHRAVRAVLSIPG